MKFIFTKTIIIFLILFSIQSWSYAQKPEVENVLNQVQLDSLMNNVLHISGVLPVVVNGTSTNIVTRHPRTTGNELAFQYLKSELIRLGYNIDSQQFNASGKNLWAVKKGTTHPKRVVIVGAHYDNMPFGYNSPGADDNGSGVSTVLEAARVMKNIELPYTVLFALWDEEELGLLGSHAFALSVESNNDTLMGYLNLDMLAWDADNDDTVEINVRPVGRSMTLLDILEKSNTDYGIDMNLKIINPGAGNSDFASFWNNNLSAIGINELYNGEDINPYWHTPNDKIEYFNENYFLKCAQLAIVTLAEMAMDSSGIVNSVRYNSNNALVQIYPNPFMDRVQISLKENGMQNSKIQVFDYSGKLYFSETLQDNRFSVNLSFLPKGMYILKIDVNDQSYSQKLIKL